MSTVNTYTYNGKLRVFRHPILTIVLSTDNITALDVSIAVTNSFPPIRKKTAESALMLIINLDKREIVEKRLDMYSL